jgi:broad specificity phosphatase PhoE
MRHHRWIAWLLLYCSLVPLSLATAAAPDHLQLLKQPGHVLLLRHANAPGVGDPPEMALSDCKTQRNLDDTGRTQARELGQRLRAAGVAKARVFSSQWCRSRETARLLDLGSVEELAALNSMFGRSDARESQITALRAFMDELPRDGGPFVMVSHQATITALTGDFPASGAGLILRLLPNGGFERVAEIAAN